MTFWYQLLINLHGLMNILSAFIRDIQACGNETLKRRLACVNGLSLRNIQVLYALLCTLWILFLCVITTGNMVTFIKMITIKIFGEMCSGNYTHNTKDSITLILCN